MKTQTKVLIGIGVGAAVIAFIAGRSGSKKSPGMSSGNVDYRGDVFFLNGPSDEEKAKHPDREGCGAGISMDGEFLCDFPFLEFDLDKKKDTRDVIDLVLERFRVKGKTWLMRADLKKLADAAARHGMPTLAGDLNRIAKEPGCCVEDMVEDVMRSAGI